MKKLKRRLQRPRYEYQILINKKVIWRGINAKEKLAELRKKFPRGKIGIRWVPKEGVLIARTNFPV